MNERIKLLRKTLGLSGEKFGEKIGIKKVAISQIETGKQGVTEQTLKSICREFNVNEEWLRNGTGEIFIQYTRDEQIATFVGSIQANEGDSFKKRLISMLSALDESDWEVLEKMVLLLQNEKD